MNRANELCGKFRKLEMAVKELNYVVQAIEDDPTESKFKVEVAAKLWEMRQEFYQYLINEGLPRNVILGKAIKTVDCLRALVQTELTPQEWEKVNQIGYQRMCTEVVVLEASA